MFDLWQTLTGSISPTTVVQAEGLDAISLCQFPTAGSAIEGQINGTSLHNVNASGVQIRREGCGNDTELLLSHNSMERVLCVFCISLNPMER